MIKRTYLFALGLMLLPLAGSVYAQQPPKPQNNTLQASPQYQQCTTLAHSNAANALTYADNWLKTSQDVGAFHCRALALYGLGRFSESADVMDKLAARVTPKQPTLWLSLMQQSSRAHQQAGQDDLAMRQLNSAIASASGSENVDNLTTALLSERAALYAKQGKYFDGLQDMDNAISISPDPALTLARAKIYKQMGANNLARRDIDETLRADPENTEAKALSAQLPRVARAPAKKTTVTQKQVAKQKKLAKKKITPSKSYKVKKTTAKKKKKKK